MTHEFTAQRRVEYAHTDMAGIVHFSRFFTYIEEAEHEMWRALGFSVHDTIDGIHYGWPRVSASLDFKAPLKFEDEFNIKIIITHISQRSLSYNVKILKEDVLCAEGAMSIVCCRVMGDGQIQSTDIPESIRQALNQL